MIKLYTLFFTLIISICGFTQVNIRPAKQADAHFQFIDNNGKPVNDLKWREAEPLVNGFAKVAVGNKWGFVDRLGNPVINASYQSVRNFVNKLAAAMQNSKWGFIDQKGKTVIPFEYDIVYDFTETVTAVYKNNKWYLINRQGAIIKRLDIDVFYGFKNGKARITRQGRNGQMNTSGTIISMEPGQDVVVKNKNTTAARPGAPQDIPCPPNIGFDFGNFTNWDCFVGNVVAVGNVNVVTVTPSAPTPNRHVIYPRATPSNLDPYGMFPINPPDGSGYAIKLGNNVNGAEAERIRYTFSVPANAVDYSITYRYAVVFQDPGHQRFEQPRLSAKLRDVANNVYLPCSSWEFISDDTIPGFFDSPVDPNIKIKSWTPVFINLSPYAGMTLELEFTTVDCVLGAHWGYGYLDIGDCNIAADIQFQCNPNITTLTGPPGFRTYQWFNDDFSTRIAVGETATLNPSLPDTANIHLILLPYSGPACSDTLHVVSMNPSPRADAGPDKVILCYGSSTTIGTPGVSGIQYAWTPATALSAPNIPRPVSSTTVNTTYILRATDPSTGCFAQDTVDVTVNPKPTALFDPLPDQCLTGNNFTFTNNSVLGSVYRWTFGDGDSSALADPVHSYAAAQTYPVKLLVTAANGCQDSITRQVRVNPEPTVITLADTSMCRGSSVRLITNGAQQYEWTPATNLNCSNCPSPVASPVTNATYIVKGTNSFGCFAYDTVDITVHQPIQVNVSPGAEMCRKDTVNLWASGATSYAWSPAQSLNNATIPNPVASPSTTTNYRVVGYDAHHCFTDTGYVSVVVNPIPTVELGPDRRLATGTMYNIDPVTTNGPIVSWQWSPATNLNCTNCSEPTATVKNDITYYVNVINEFGCKGTDSLTITTFCENSQVFVPNAFTPDGDGINDILMIRAKGVESVKLFRVFTRWGELIFEKSNFPPNSPAFGWDGKIKGKTGAPEVYVYTLEVTCDNLQTYTYKGNVSILK